MYFMCLFYIKATFCYQYDKYYRDYIQRFSVCRYHTLITDWSNNPDTWQITKQYYFAIAFNIDTPGAV